MSDEATVAVLCSILVMSFADVLGGAVEAVLYRIRNRKQ